MKNFSTNNFKKGWQMIATIFFLVVLIATCCGVWNFCPEAAVKVGAGLSLVGGGLLSYLFMRSLHKE